MSGRQPLHVAQHGPWHLHIAEFDIIAKGGRAEGRAITRQTLEYGKLRARNASVRCGRVKQRLLAQPIPPQHKPPGGLIPNEKGKHSAQSTKKVDTPAFIAVEQDFSIAAAAKLMAEFPQFLAQALKIVNLTVKHEPEASVLVGHRLRCRGG